MKDPDIKHQIEQLKLHVSEINKIITDLHTKGVEIQLTYDNNINGKASTTPSLEIWRAVEKVDYL
jgi:hypothetical protein